MAASAGDVKRQMEEQGGQLPAYLQRSYEESERRARELSNRPYAAYPGQRFAPSSDALLRAIQMGQNVGVGNPYLEQSHQNVLRGTQNFPEGYRGYLDPYQMSVVNQIREQGNKFLKETALPELEGRFARLGQHGSSRHARLALKATADIQKQIAAQQEEALSRGYQQAMSAFNADRARDLQAAHSLATLGVSQRALRAADIQALKEAGLTEQDIAQRERDLAYEQWKEEQRHPLEALSHYFSVLQGVPYVPTTYAKSDITRTPMRQSMHGSDWRDMGMSIGGDFLLNRLLSRARGGRVKQRVGPHLMGEHK